MAKETQFKPKKFFNKTRIGWNNNTSKGGQEAVGPAKPHTFATSEAKEFPNVRCYGCNEMGHYRNKCPKRVNQAAAIAPPVYHEEQGNRGGRGRGKGRGRGRVARAYERGRGRIAFARGIPPEEPTLAEDVNERATLYAAMITLGHNNNTRSFKPNKSTR